MAIHDLAASVAFLVDQRLLLAQFAGGGVQDQVALLIHTNSLRAGES